MNGSKGSGEEFRSDTYRENRTKKRSSSISKYEKEEMSTSTSAKKFKRLDDISVPEEENIGYRILNFITVFTAISELIRCKTCSGDIKFKTERTQGLGFNILVVCASCDPISIPSCPYIGTAYEINRRFFFAMRLLGTGLNGAKKFCGIMDLPSPLAQNIYDTIVDNIYRAATTVCDVLLKNAVKEEKKIMCEEENLKGSTELFVSGSSTWKKCGFTSLFGVSSVIGSYSGKILDFVVKSSTCRACEWAKRFWNKETDIEIYKLWQIDHETTCSANREAGKMEIETIREIFSRSVERYGVKYITFIGDNDSKTYAAIVNSKPYGDNTTIRKKECIDHVQRRMGNRLRAYKKKSNNLGEYMIDKLIKYYGMAIRGNYNSVELMKKAIWAAFYHYGSTNEQPHHHYCPQGLESWCSWHRASAKDDLKNYVHEKALSENVLNDIRPIYEDFSNDTLLERCLGGFTQSNNENLNNMIWEITPKVMHNGTKIMQTTTCIAICIFNEGASSLLKIMRLMNVAAGPNAHQYAIMEDEHRIAKTERAAQEMTKAARLRKQARLEMFEVSLSKKGLFRSLE